MKLWEKIKTLPGNSASAIKKGGALLWNADTKRLTALALVIFVVYYAISGFGKTVITDFKIPDTLKKELKGIDERSLTRQLLVELHRIQALQQATAGLAVDVVRGLDALNVIEDPLAVNLSGRINLDYKTVVENIGAVDWGAVKMPAELLMRPFQFCIRQKVLQLSLHAVDGRMVISGVCDDGSAWSVREQDIGRPKGDASPSGDDVLSAMLRLMAMKIASSDGAAYRSENNYQAYYHAVEGVRYLVEYYRRLESVSDQTPAGLNHALAHFEKSLALDPNNFNVVYNRLLVLLESVFYLKPDETPAYLDGLIFRIKDVYPRFKEHADDFNVLLTAADLLAGESLAAQTRYPEALTHYQQAQAYFTNRPHLTAFVLNNMGQAYEKLGATDQALEHYQKALSHNPDYARAYLNMGNIMVRKGDFAQGETCFAAAVERRPAYVNAYYNLALLPMRLKQAGRYGQCTDACRSCLAQQAGAAARTYLRSLEAEQNVRNLKPDELDRLTYARHLLKNMPAAGEAGNGRSPTPAFGRCLSTK